MDGKLGKKVRDSITGFEGIATSMHIYMTGCNQYGVQGKVDKDNKIPDKEYFDEGRIEVIGEGVKPEDVQIDKPGCDFREHPNK